MKRSTLLYWVILLWNIGGGTSLAAPSSSVRSLAGLTGVRIVVEDLNPAMQKTGLRKEHLYTLTQQQLEKHGPPILPPQPPGKTPVLYVRLSSVIAAAQDEAPVGMYLIVQVKQWAHLTQPTAIVCEASTPPGAEPLLVTTWEQGTMVMTSRKDVFFYVRQVLINILAELAQDSRTAKREAQ